MVLLMNATISDTMKAALGSVVADYDKATQQELKNWGLMSATVVSNKGIPVVPSRTIKALVSRGLLRVTQQHVQEHSELRRSSFGRPMYGWSRMTHSASWMVVPTDAGRALVE